MVCGRGAATTILAFYDPNQTAGRRQRLRLGTASSFGLPFPLGGDSQVMRFNRTENTEGLKLDFNDPANGVFQANGWVANYTLVFDLFYPASTAACAPLQFQSAKRERGRSIDQRRRTAAVQVAGPKLCDILANTWHHDDAGGARGQGGRTASHLCRWHIHRGDGFERHPD